MTEHWREVCDVCLHENIYFWADVKQPVLLSNETAWRLILGHRQVDRRDLHVRGYSCNIHLESSTELHVTVRNVEVVWVDKGKEKWQTNELTQPRSGESLCSRNLTPTIGLPPAFLFFSTHCTFSGLIYLKSILMLSFHLLLGRTKFECLVGYNVIIVRWKSTEVSREHATSIVRICPEDGGDIFLRNCFWYSTEYTALHHMHAAARTSHPTKC
jgi:hypothetical protein